MPCLAPSSLTRTSLLVLFRFDSSFDAVDVTDDDDEGEGGAGEPVALRNGRGMVRLVNVLPMHPFFDLSSGTYEI